MRKKWGPICKEPECARPHYQLGWCTRHFYRMKRYGDLTTTLRGEYGKGFIDKGYGRKSVRGKVISIHRTICEKALGKPLPRGAVVHHANGNPSDNRNCNLVICQDGPYHRHLHLRMKSLRECGNPNLRRCGYCNKYDDAVAHVGKKYFHMSCRKDYARHRYLVRMGRA